MFLLKNKFYVLKFENMCEKLYTISLKVSLSFKHVTAGLMYIEIPQFNNFFNYKHYVKIRYDHHNCFLFP